MLKQTLLLSVLFLGLSACQSANVSHQEPVQLQGSWHIEAVQGQPTVDYSPAQITFDAEGNISGNNSCNHFFGQYSQQGQALQIIPGGSTMKACVDALMQQEHKVMQALPLVAKAKLVKGRLTLLSSDAKAILVLTQLK